MVGPVVAYCVREGWSRDCDEGEDDVNGGYECKELMKESGPRRKKEKSDVVGVLDRAVSTVLTKKIMHAHLFRVILLAGS